MGCASSKQSKCKHCKAPYSPPMTRRSFSMNVHHPPEKEGDSYHVVALTSSTLGSMKLDAPKHSMWDDFSDEDDDPDCKNHDDCGEKSKEFNMGMVEAKAWSKMIDEKITRVVPRTPIRTPPGEPETINVGELMEGLEDYSPLRVGEHVRSFSFHVSADSIPSLIDSPRTVGGFQLENAGVSPKKTIWSDSAEKDSTVLGNGNVVSNALVSQFDPEVISAFRKALEELSPTNPIHIKPRDGVREQQQQMNGIMALEATDQEDLNVISSEVAEDKKMNGFDNGCDHVNGIVDRIITEEEKENLIPIENGHVHTNGCLQEEESLEEEYEDEGDMSENEDVHYAKKRLILYFTSLRGVRKTYEDCCYVRLILKGLGVRVDERDVSMHSGFKEELKELLGEGFKGGLPKVFVGEDYIGDVEEIRRLHEDGKLEKVIQGCEMMDDDGGNLIDVCEACGDVRFIPCETCSGSCKIYYEFEEDDQEYEEDEYGFQRCPDCNENGLVRCPMCCD